MFDIENIKPVKNGRYLAIMLPDHPSAWEGRGYVAMHRVVMENHLGRLLASDEHVHHINNNGHDNRIENLEVMSASDHMRHHCKAPTILTIACDECGIYFERPKNQMAGNKGYSKSFCSRSCSGRNTRRLQISRSRMSAG